MTRHLTTPEGAGNVHEVEYSFSATQHNGNVQQQVIRHSGLSWTQNYTYDSMNRLATAVETGGFDRTYRYDRWGNRWVNPSTGLTNQDPLEPASDIFDDNTNRIAGTGNYDAAGNLTDYAPYTLAYDGENRMVSMTSGANGNMTLTYDGEGRRLKKVWAGAQPATVVYVYDAFGQVAAEYQSGGTTVPGTQYLTQDWLGSTRVVTDEAGAVTARNDFLPFGRPLYAGENGRTEAMKYGVAPVGTAGRPWVRQLFTGHERDVEVDSGLDYFGARYFSGAQGRFTSPDSPSYSKLSYPQTWNLYAYALNNPLSYIDPTGHEIVCANNAEQCKKDAQASMGNAAAASRVTTATTVTKHSFLGIHWTTSKTTIAIQGDIASFRKLGQNASRLADMVADTTRSVTVTYDRYAKASFWANGIDLRGGSISWVPSQDYAAQAWIDPGRGYSQPYDTDAVAQGIPQANTGEEFAHEVLGHVWGELYGGHPVMLPDHRTLAPTARAGMRDSIAAENAARRLDPARGQKGLESHHNYNEMPPERR